MSLVLGRKVPNGKAVNGILGSPGLEKHPAETFIGRIERGFDFPGYYFGSDTPRHIPNEPSPRIKT